MRPLTFREHGVLAALSTVLFAGACWWSWGQTGPVLHRDAVLAITGFVWTAAVLSFAIRGCERARLARRYPITVRVARAGQWRPARARTCRPHLYDHEQETVP
jgi:hypothetical protein